MNPQSVQWSGRFPTPNTRNAMFSSGLPTIPRDGSPPVAYPYGRTFTIIRRIAPTVTPYDLTDTYSEGKRADHPLSALGLVLDAGGFVCRLQVFAGNVCEHRTLAGMLDAPDALPGALVVTDRGIATGERQCWLRGQG